MVKAGIWGVSILGSLGIGFVSSVLFPMPWSILPSFLGGFGLGWFYTGPALHRLEE